MSSTKRAMILRNRFTVGWGFWIEAGLGTKYQQAAKRCRISESTAPTSLRIADSIIVATRFDYLSENRCRSFLHRIGFMEIVLVTVDDLTGDPATWAISHARPITCDPLFIEPRRPVAEPERPILWLIARRLPLHGSPEASDA